MNIHNGRKFSCPYCDYQASQKINLKIHILRLHEGKLPDWNSYIYLFVCYKLCDHVLSLTWPCLFLSLPYRPDSYILKPCVLLVPKMYLKIYKHVCMPDTQHINKGNDSRSSQQKAISISKDKSLDVVKDGIMFV